MSKVMELDRFKEMVLEVMREERIKLTTKTSKKRGGDKHKKKENAVLLLSDIHVGKENYFIDETGKSVLTYHTGKMFKEAEVLIEKVMTINRLLSYELEIQDLHIFILGDIVDGDMIVSGQKFFVEFGVGEQVITAVKLLSLIIENLAPIFQKVNCVVISGNHGRMTQKSRAMHPFYNNFDYLVGKFLQERFSRTEKVKVKVPEDWFFIETIYNWKYFLHHGASVSSWLGLPYYGIVRQGMARRAEYKIDIECLGHFHTVFEIPVSSNSITLVNGCWIEKNDYSWRKFGKISKAEQIYFGVSPKRARTWQFVLNLGEGGDEK